MINENSAAKIRISARQQAQARVAIDGLSAKLTTGETESLVVMLSTEASRRVQTDEKSRTGEIEAGLQSFLMSISIKQKPKKKSSVKRRVVWSPSAKVGQIKDGLSVMGRLQIVDRVEEQSDSEPLTISINNTGSNSQINISVNDSSNEEPPKIQGGEALQNLMRSGLVADGLKELLDEDKSGQARAGSRNLTVRTNGTGRQRVLSVSEAGVLNSGVRTLGAFQVLDNKPILRKPTDISSIFGEFAGNQSAA